VPIQPVGDAEQGDSTNTTATATTATRERQHIFIKSRLAARDEIDGGAVCVLTEHRAHAGAELAVQSQVPSAMVELFGLLPFVVYWASVALLGLVPFVPALQQFKYSHVMGVGRVRNRSSAVAVCATVLAHHALQVMIAVLLLPPPRADSHDRWWRQVSRVLAYVAVDETYTYWWHWSMHHFPLLFSLIHEKHHRIENVYPAASQYAGIVDMLAGVWVPNVLASVISGLSPSWVVWLLTLRTIKVNYDHLGYVLPFPLNPTSVSWLPLWNAAIYHHHHHEPHGRKYNLSGGFTNVWDIVNGTRKLPRPVATGHDLTQADNTAVSAR
jgi:sterol desaturase/sphingolipid hydroxylase (fatty acid hydroxylase superfamily)